MAKKLTRRDFLKIGATGAAVSVLTGCQNPRHWVELEPYVIPPEQQLAGQPTWYATTCRQCPAGCGVIVRIMNGRALKLEGNPEHPLNQGKLCARGQAGLQVLYNPDRLEGPVQQSQRGSHQFQSLQWDQAMQTLTSKIQSAGKNVAIWLGSNTSGHLVDLFQRFATAIGAPQPLVFDLYSAFQGYPALHASSMNLLGQDQIPAYDLGQADVVLSFGSDFLGTGTSSTRYGIEYGRMRGQDLGKRGYLVQLEPYMSNTGVKADRWLPLRPGSEALVAQAIARLIADRGYGSQELVSRAKELAPDIDPQVAAQASDLTLDVLDSLARTFANSARPLAIPPVPLAGRAQSEAAITAVQMLNVIAGVIGQPGGIQPAADYSSINLNLVQTKPSSFADMLNLIQQMQGGQIQALLVYGANPFYDLPESTGFQAALAKVPFVASFAPIMDETANQSDLVLPDRTYLESWGYSINNPNFGVPVISSQQPVVTPVYDNRATADVLLAVAQAIPAAASALMWKDEVAFLKDTFAKLPVGAPGGNTPQERWIRYQQHGGWWPIIEQPAAPSQSNPPAPQKTSALEPIPYQGNVDEYPYFLHPFMTPLLADGSGANQPWLQGSPETNTSIMWQTWVALNPATAEKLNLKKGDVVKVSSPNGSLEAPVYVYPGVRPDTVAIPLGQGHSDFGRYASNRGANVIKLLGVQSGDSAGWSAVRVKVEATGQNKAVATFEYTLGVQEGFFNQGFPGQ
ncbi:MAG: molybdopterin-dependent oxidoreductase [Anaerolineales bacterium]|jgi:anaerobic selenocysteine-containing dehydrogenase